MNEGITSTDEIRMKDTKIQGVPKVPEKILRE